MKAEEIFNVLQEKHSGRVVGGVFDVLDPSIEVEPGALAEVCRTLRDEPSLRFDMLHCISGVDYFEPDEKKAAKVDWEPHFELLYHLSSMVHRHRIVVRLRMPRWRDGVERAVCRKFPACVLYGGRSIGTNARYTICAVWNLRSATIFAAYSVPTTGKGIRCARIISRPTNTKGLVLSR